MMFLVLMIYFEVYSLHFPDSYTVVPRGVADLYRYPFNNNRTHNP